MAHNAKQVISIRCYRCKRYRKPRHFEGVPGRGKAGPFRCLECERGYNWSGNICQGCGQSLGEQVSGGTLCGDCLKEVKKFPRVRLKPPKTKRCRLCGEFLPIVDFGFARATADGRNSICRNCNVGKTSVILARQRLSSPGTQLGKIRLAGGKRRAKKKGRPVEVVSVKDLAMLWKHQKGTCRWCGKGLNPFEDCTIDHLVPVSKGGGHTMENLVFACSRCNFTRNDGKTSFSLYLSSIGSSR